MDNSNNQVKDGIQQKSFEAREEKRDFRSAGFDVFLNRKPPISDTQPEEELLEDEASSKISQISGSNLVSGTSKSPDGKLLVDWQKGEVSFSDGARKRVLFGDLEGTGVKGMRVVDAKGNVRFESSDGLEVLSMFDEANEKEIIRLDETGLLLKDLLANNLVKLNSDGLFVYDTAGNILVQLDASGIVVNTGKITIKNEDEVTIIDAKGLVSSANFQFDNYTAENQITRAGDWIDVTGSSLSFSLTRTTRVLFMLTVLTTIKIDSAGEAQVNVAVNVDDVRRDPIIFKLEYNTITGVDERWETMTTQFVLSLGAGDHTAKIQWRGMNGATAYMLSRSLTYLILGT